MGHESVIYVDDSFLQADSYEDCIDNARDTILLLQNLGFKIHLEKSILIATQEITFLGFVINSVIYNYHDLNRYVLSEMY